MQASEIDLSNQATARINVIPSLAYTRSSNGNYAYRLTEDNMGLATHIAKKYRGRGVDFPTLVRDAEFGLIEAERDFDPSKGRGEFSDYAGIHIRKNIQRRFWDYLKSNGPIPYHVASRRGKISASERTLAHELSRMPTPEEVAAHFNCAYYPDKPGKHIKATHVESLRNAKKRRELETKMESEESEKRTKRSVKAYDSEIESVETRDSIRRMNELLANGVLDKQEKDVLRMRYGLDGNEPMTLQEVSKCYGTSRNWIHLIEKRAIKILKEIMCQENN